MKTVPLTVGGVPLAFAPLLAATLSAHKDALRQAFAQQLDRLDEIELTVKLATASAKRVDPSITEERMAELIDTENAPVVFQAVFYGSIPAPDPGETKADSPST